MGTRVMRAVIALIVVCLNGTFADDSEREPKLLFVSRTTSTSVSVTTTLSSARATCLMQTAGKITAACTSRKKRSVLVDDDLIKLDEQHPAIEDISRVSRNMMRL